MIEDVLCGMSAVRYAVVVPDPVAGTWIAAVEAWVGTAVDAGTCVHAVADAYGPDIARRLRMCFVSQVPRSAQGKPDRDAILELGHAFCPET
jgi:acyl-coenzyme A synthetase/AMP-(fatty) acid ligase